MIFTPQTRLSFDTDHLLRMGITRADVVPFSTNNECLAEPDTIVSNLQELARKAEIAAKKGLEVYPFFVTINHPEGNYEIPSRYRRQQNLDGSERSAFICFRDTVRQEEIIRYAGKAAELGFKRIAFDDDLRDAFCYCNEHLNGFEPFRGKTRDEIGRILNDVLTHPEYEELRIQWYRYKYEGMKEYAIRMEQAVHSVNPYCRIGLCNSAKRCQDFSGRKLGPGQTPCPFTAIERGKVTAAVLLQTVFIHRGPRGDHLRDLTRDQRRASPRQLDLFANGDLESGINQFSYVRTRRMIGNAAEGNRIGFVTVACRQRDIE